MTVKLRTSLLATPVLTLLAGAAIPASAQVGPVAGGSVSGDDYVVVETFTLAGDRVATEAFSSDGIPIPVPSDFESQGTVGADSTMLAEFEQTKSPTNGEVVAFGSGTGGSSSSSGCRTVTVRNEKETLLGLTAYWLNTWTKWCWNLGNRTISDVETGWHLDDVDPLYTWRGLIVDEESYFAWIAEYGKSGYRHEKQGHFEICLPDVVCIGNYYPRNLLRSHSDGTWSWETGD